MRTFILFLLLLLALLLPANLRAQAIFVKETVQSAGNIGYGTSVALDGVEAPHVAYFDFGNGDLRYARKAGGSWILETADGSTHNVGQFVSLAMEGSGVAHIAYLDATTLDLKYARRSGGVWTREFADSTGIDLGRYASIALDASGNPHIAYWNGTVSNLKYARKSGAVWVREVGDGAAGTGLYTSIALDAQANPHVSYFDDIGKNLKYARRVGGVWMRETVDAAGFVGPHTSIELDGQGNPHISYYDMTNGDVKYARKTGGTWILEIADGSSHVGVFDTSLELDLLGNPRIAYHDSIAGDLRYARKGNGTWVVQIVDAANDVGKFSSLALSATGQPRISYYDETLGDLRFASLVPDTAVFSTLTNTALGQASLANQGQRLVVGEIGGSGQDGVAIFAPLFHTFRAKWEDLGDAEGYPVGAFLQVNATAHAPDPILPPDPVYPPTPVRATNLGTELEITADFDGIGAPTKTVEVYDGGVLVARRTGLTNPLARVSMWPSRAGAFLGEPAPSGALAGPEHTKAAGDTGSPYPDPAYELGFITVGSILIVENTLLGDSAVFGDEIRIIAEASADAPVGFFGDFRLWAKNVPTVELEDEILVVPTSVPALGGTVTLEDGLSLAPYPNPALGGKTSVRFRVPSNGSLPADLMIYDITGRRIRTLAAGLQPGTEGVAVWDGRLDDGRPAAAGVYLLRLRGGGVRETARLVLVR